MTKQSYSIDPARVQALKMQRGSILSDQKAAINNCDRVLSGRGRETAGHWRQKVEALDHKLKAIPGQPNTAGYRAEIEAEKAAAERELKRIEDRHREARQAVARAEADNKPALRLIDSCLTLAKEFDR